MTDPQNQQNTTEQLDKPREDILLTRADKNPLVVHSRVMPAAGTYSYGEVYRDIVNIEKLGAIVTHPVSLAPRTPAGGTRVIPVEGGVLMHTGLPNVGLREVLSLYRNLWLMIPVPVIVHLMATTTNAVRDAMAILSEEETVDAVELGLSDDTDWEMTERLVKAATAKTELPVLVRVNLQDTVEIAEVAADMGAGAIVCAAPPRGTARDPINGRLISGRIYGPLVKPLALNTVGLLAKKLRGVPIIGAGGIHTLQDARDFIEAGATAVQVDSVTWLKPKQLEYIARDLAGMTITKESDALADEWQEGMGSTTLRRRRGDKTTRSDSLK